MGLNIVDDQQTAVLQSVLSSGGEVPASLQDLIAQITSSGDPVTAVALQYLVQRQVRDTEMVKEPEDEPGADGEAAVRYVEEQRIRSRQALRVLQQRVEALCAEVDEARARNQDLAAALGACAKCWGDDGACRVCDGQGRPGNAPSDAYLYVRLVLPAVRRLNHWDPVDAPSTLPAHTAEERSGTRERREG